VSRKPTTARDRQWLGSLFLGTGYASYVGPAGDTDEHAHHAVQVCIGLDAAVRVWTEGTWAEYPGVAIGSDVRHRIAGGTGRVTLLYLEPESLSGHFLSAKRSGVTALDGQLVDKLSKIAAYISTASDSGAERDGHRRFLAALDLRSFAPTAADPRIACALAAVREAPARFSTVTLLAKHAGLSASRFRELFAESTTISCRRYLVWARLQRAVAAMSRESSLTRAAHDAGFADSAHLARVFRAMFGIAPSTLGRGVRFLTE
jgi:AraC family transcriptional regulator